VTNYIHFLGAGHVAEQLKLIRSFYPFSQQGWEALNSHVKGFLHHKTNHGGGRASDAR
ncbi:unnamed protein product, partial [Phaeothamnion confervicola]